MTRGRSRKSYSLPICLPRFEQVGCIFKGAFDGLFHTIDLRSQRAAPFRRHYLFQVGQHRAQPTHDLIRVGAVEANFVNRQGQKVRPRRGWIYKSQCAALILSVANIQPPPSDAPDEIGNLIPVSYTHLTLPTILRV